MKWFSAQAPLSRRVHAVQPRAKRGFTLLEVVLALAILVGAIAVVGELIRLGGAAAASARDLSQAQLLAESVMAEITAGILPLENSQSVPIETDPEWVYGVELLPVETPGLLAVRVTVVQAGAAGRPAEFALVRWMRDPGVELPAQSADSETSSASSSGTSSSNSSSGSGS